MNPEKKQFILGLLILLAVAVLGLGGYKLYQKRKLAKKIAGPKLEIPQAKTEIKILKVLEKKSNQIWETRDIHSGEKAEVFIPSDVKPNFIGVQDIRKDYVLELFKYQPAANNLVALSLDVVKNFPTTNIFPTKKNLLIGTVSDMQKGVLVLAHTIDPGGGRADRQKVVVGNFTTYTQVLRLGKAAIIKPAKLADVQKGSNLNVFYDKQSASDELKANKIEILVINGGLPTVSSTATLPIPAPTKQ